MPLKPTARRSHRAAPLIALLLVIVAACTPAPVATNVPGATSTPRPATATTRPTNTPRPPTATVPLVAPTSDIPTPLPFDEGVSPIRVGQGFGARLGFWEIYFTDPTGSRDESTYIDGIDEALAAAIDGAQQTLDIAAYEFNNPRLTQAVLSAHARGVRVRVVSDDEHGVEDSNATLDQLAAAGIPIVDDARTALMHNKFMIIDGAQVWMGSWNYTINGTYRNNNNALALRARRIAQIYQLEFDEMFIDGEFGVRSPVNTPLTPLNLDGTSVEVWFAPESAVDEVIVERIANAQSSIRFMAFSFTLENIGDALLERANAGVRVEGIFERLGSQTQFSRLTPLFCAGLPVRQDGNPFMLHHKVFIIDDQIVLTGSFNFSANATNNNDENMLIITDRDLAQQYIQEYNRRWAEASTPTALTCN